jgi:hypothetical protein
MSEIKWMPKIRHMDEMDPSDFEEALTAMMDGDYRATEKIDGQNLSFGLDDGGRLYTKTKRSRPVHDASFYEGVPYLKGFLRLHRELEEIAEDVLKAGVQLFGELVPYSQTNTICYDPERVPDGGIVVLFDAVGASDTQLEDALHRFATGLNRALNTRRFDVIRETPAQSLSGTYLEHVRLFKRLLAIVKDGEDDRAGIAEGLLPNVQWSIKRQILRLLNSAYGRSMLGIETEGFVVSAGGHRFKVVDKESFSERNREMHAQSTAIQQLNRKSRRRVRQEVFGNPDVLASKKKAVEKVKEAATVARQNGDGPVDPVRAVLDDIESEVGLPCVDETREVTRRVMEDHVRRLSEIRTEWLQKDMDSVSRIAEEVTEDKMQNSLDWIWDVRGASICGDQEDFERSAVRYVLGIPTIRRMSRAASAS